MACRAMGAPQMTPEQRIQACRDAGWTEDHIRRNLYAIKTGRIAGVSAALEQNQAAGLRQIRGDAEIAEAKAKYGDPFSTKAGIAWIEAKGFMVIASEETVRAGLKTFRRDTWGGWDAVAMKTGRLHFFQFLTGATGDLTAHIAKLSPDSQAMRRAVKAGGERWMLQFERGEPVPLKTFRYKGEEWTIWATPIKENDGQSKIEND